MTPATAIRPFLIGTTVFDGKTESFTMPPDWITSTNAILAKKRSGKSWLAGVIEEELCKARLQWGTLDPVSAHWGIREKYPVVVFGGEHADIPIRPDMGAEIARAVTQEGFSFIIDIKRETRGTQRRVVTEFCNEMLLVNKTPIHLFIEECTEFVPQIIRPDQTVAFDAVDRLVRLGGGNGIGITLISQRAAGVNKAVLEQIDTLFVLRMTGTNDVKAVRDWLEQKELTDKVLEVTRSLARLPTGTTWVWSHPDALNFFGQVAVRARETFHAGATPKVGQKVTARLVEVDVDALRKRFEAIPKPDGKKGVAPPPDGKDKFQTSSEILAQKEALIRDMRSKTTHLEGIAKEQGDVIALLRRQLDSAQHEADAARALGKALRVLIGGAPAPAGKGGAVDIDAVAEAVLARLPKGQSGGSLAVAAPAALRQKFQEDEVRRLVEKLRGLDPEMRAIISLLESTGKALPIASVCGRLGVAQTGTSWQRVKANLANLEGMGFVSGTRGHGFEGRLKAKIADDLAAYDAAEADIEQVYQHALYALAQE